MTFERVRIRTVDVGGIRIFYREAGDPLKPTILLLHGFPSSSHMYRDLMPLLADRFHLVAPDYPGCGFSKAPPPARFEPTFSNLAKVMEGFVQAIGLSGFILYMQDFGGPVGFRIASDRPELVDGLIIQNANAYVDAFTSDVLKGMKELYDGPLTQQHLAWLDHFHSPENTVFQYRAGARDFDAIDPASYTLDIAILAQPESQRIQRSLNIDYYDNVLQYPKWQAYLREHRPKTLIVWGKNDPIFAVAGAHAYRRDVPEAELHLYDTGHFALEEDAPAIASEILRFFGK